MNLVFIVLVTVLLVVALACMINFATQCDERMMTRYHANDIIAKCPTPRNNKDLLLFKCDNKNHVAAKDLIVEPGYKTPDGKTYTVYRLVRDMDLALL